MKIEEVQLYVAETEKHVSELKQHIRELEAAGGSTARARALLANFEASLNTKVKILQTLQATTETSPKQDE
jgi:hypothetical protein